MKHLCLATIILFLSCNNLYSDDFEDTDILPIITNSDSLYVKYEQNPLKENSFNNYYGPEKISSKVSL